MRRLIPTVVAALVLLSGCGTERPGAAPAAEPSSEPAPTPSAKPTLKPSREPTTTSATDLTSALAEFPLALGFDDENGDDHSPVVVRDVPATKAFDECGRRVWDPREGTTDVIGVEFRGEAEWFRGRTLVLYPDESAATAAVDRVHDGITNCPRDDGDDYGWAEHTGINYDAGDQSYGWIDRWWTTELDGFDTGLTIYHVVRVGRAVLFTYEYGEGNGSEQTRLSAFARAERADEPLVASMGALPTSAEATIGADRPCAALETTPEGIAVGDSYDDLLAAYSNLEPFGTGGSNAVLSDQGDAAYAFTLDGDRELADWSGRRVTSIWLLPDGRHCSFA